MSKKLLTLVVALLWALPSWALLDPAAVQAAHRLFITLDMAAKHHRVVNLIVEEYVFQNPNMQPYKGLIKSELTKKFPWSSIEPEMARLFAKRFTTRELNEINAFYSTPTGQKLSNDFVNLMLWTTEISRQRLVTQLHDVLATMGH